MPSVGGEAFGRRVLGMFRKRCSLGRRKEQYKVSSPGCGVLGQCLDGVREECENKLGSY